MIHTFLPFSSFGVLRTQSLSFLEFISAFGPNFDPLEVWNVTNPKFALPRVDLEVCVKVRPNFDSSVLPRARDPKFAKTWGLVSLQMV